MSNTLDDEETLLTEQDVARITSIKTGTLRALRFRGQIPFVRLGGGRIIRYRRDEIDAWIASHSVQAGAQKAG